MATGSVNINSGIHQLPPNCYPPSESDDEDSFVVLNNSLGPDVFKDSVVHTEPISTSVLELSLDSVSEILAKTTLIAAPESPAPAPTSVDGVQSTYTSTEFSPEEIQRKVDDLIGENTKLKDTLAQNNIAMKKQVETLAQWQQDVQRVQESHKERFNEMKKYINVLKGENMLLKNATLSETKIVEEPKQAATEVVTKKNIMEFELEGALKKIKELEKALDQISLEKEDLVKEYAQHLRDPPMSSEIKKLDVVNGKLIEELHESKAILDMLELDIASLACEKRSVDEQNAVLKKRIDELEVVNDELSKETDKAKEEVRQLTTKNQTFAQINEELTEKMLALKDECDVDQRRTRDEIAALQRANFETTNFQETLNSVRQQLMASQMHITELKEQNTKNLAEKEEEIGELRKQIKEAAIADDELAALRAQVELYKNDFEIERQSKTDILAEKNKVAGDLFHLQRRNQQLLDKVEQLRSGFVHVVKDMHATAPSATPNSRFSCPRCSFRFPNYQALEHHVYHCIELDTLP